MYIHTHARVLIQLAHKRAYVYPTHLWIFHKLTWCYATTPQGDTPAYSVKTPVFCLVLENLLRSYFVLVRAGLGCTWQGNVRDPSYPCSPCNAYTVVAVTRDSMSAVICVLIGPVWTDLARVLFRPMRHHMYLPYILTWRKISSWCKNQQTEGSYSISHTWGNNISIRALHDSFFDVSIYDLGTHLVVVAIIIFYVCTRNIPDPAIILHTSMITIITFNKDRFSK